ncbi:MAG TPA: hypothetical protein VMZ28_20300 [Kofleriaceae bacterium]|nr:hypothetical protein [Kofleriaceae bacterium]
MAVWLVAGCGGSSGGGADAAPPADAADTWDDCNPDEVRSERTAEISGQVIDYVELDSIDSAYVEFTTAWDTNSIAPAEQCGVIDSFRTGDDGRFGPETLEVGSQLTPPIALFEVSEGGRARTLSDQSMTCEGADGVCLAPDPLIRAPAAALGLAWREELEARGVADALGRGVVVFEYREADGTPAEGVTATLWGGESAEELEVDVQVSYLAADRTALAPAGTSATTESGVALISVDAPYNAVTIGGHRGAGEDAEQWDDVGVLVMRGWFFLEDQRVSAP